MKTVSIILGFLLLAGIHVSGQEDEVTSLKIDPEKIHQEIHSFGASDSWRAQFVGEHWPVAKREKIAGLLFSLEEDPEGNPLGIGLSNWRFYLGAGSMEQGDSAEIRNVWRRSECFLDAEGNYDWNKYKGQRWFLQAAKNRGVPEFTIYTISPPVFYTKNGLAHATKGDLGFNLKADRYDDYARFLVDVIAHFDQKENIHFGYVSPFNEPQWAWDQNNQEGTPATNNQLYVFLKVLSEELDSRGLSTKIRAAEAASREYLYEPRGNNFNGDQIQTFFNPVSPLYIGDFKNLEYALSSHSYFTTWPLEKQIETRQKLARKIEAVNPQLDFWQTEFCILERNDEIAGGWGRDLKMPTALYVARVIHSDLTIANSRSWEWWTALSQFNFKDGLIHLDDGKGNGVENDTSALNRQLMFDGEISETKLLWALGNYSRFVRPGMVRIDVEQENRPDLLEQATRLQVSGFMDKETGKMILVFINHTTREIPVELNGVDFARRDARLYITDKTRDLEKTDCVLQELVIPERSVSTLEIKMRQ